MMISFHHCEKCDKRYPGCRASCKKYKDEEIIAEKSRKQYDHECDVLNYEWDNSPKRKERA